MEGVQDLNKFIFRERGLLEECYIMFLEVLI
jgi:hypothetical protein